MFQAGLISQEEYDRLKQELIADAPLPPLSAPIPPNPATAVRAPAEVPPPASKGEVLGGFCLTAWLLAAAVTGVAVALALDYRSRFQAWVDGGARRSGSALDNLVESGDHLEIGFGAAQGAFYLATLLTIIWTYRLSKEGRQGPTPGQMVASWFIPVANLVLIPLRLTQLSGRLGHAHRGQDLRALMAWATSASIVACLAASVIELDLQPEARSNPPVAELRAWVNASMWVPVTAFAAPIAMAVYTASLLDVRKPR